MVSKDVVAKYNLALDIARSNKDLEQYIPRIRETLAKLLNPNYWATIDEIVWVECFTNIRIGLNEEVKMDRTKLREFTKTDWSGFAGAQEFKDGSSPLIMDVDLVDSWYTILIDQNLIEIMIMITGNSGEDTKDFFIQMEGCRKLKILIVEAMLTKLKEVSTREEFLEILKADLDLVEGF